MGTTTHKVLECLAIGKKYEQDHPNENIIVIEDEALGKLTYNKADWYKEYVLTAKDVAAINKTRINKQVYRHECFLTEGHVRMGVSVLEDIIARAVAYYSPKSEEPFDGLDIKNITNWCWMPLDAYDGEYDPRKRNIHAPEKNFEFPIDKEWAYYHYTLKGEDLIGQFAIKGTIDLITKIDDDTLEIVDWKTGQRLNWATGQTKTYDDLCKDKQLLLYYYAARRAFPEFKNIILTIYFVRDGGPYTVTFDDSDMDKMESILEKHFTYVQNCDKPRPINMNQSDFRCQKLCNYYKNNQPGTRENICRFMQNEIKKKGIEKVIDEHSSEGFELGSYASPGE